MPDYFAVHEKLVIVSAFLSFVTEEVDLLVIVLSRRKLLQAIGLVPADRKHVKTYLTT